MIRRRLLLSRMPATLLALAAPAGLKAQSSRGAGKQEPLRIGVDPAARPLLASLLRGFGGYSGLATRVVVGPSTRTLEATERGELDVAVTLAPAHEERLLQQGLVHDRRPLGRLELLLVGPTDLGIARGRDVVAAMRRIAAAGLPFIGRHDGSGLHLAEQSLWRAAGIAPAGAWYQPADSAPLLQARFYRACLLIERGAWANRPARERFGVLADGDPRLLLPVHAMRASRSPHPAAKLFVGWAGGASARRIVAAQAGVRPHPTAAR